MSEYIVTLLLGFLCVALLYTIVRIKYVMKRDGTAKIEVNKRYQGVVLEHVEEFPPYSVEYVTLELSGLRFFSSEFFESFGVGEDKISSKLWPFRIALLLLIIALFSSNTLILLLSFLAVGLHAKFFHTLSHYYYLRYFEVDLMIEYEEDPEDDNKD